MSKKLIALCLSLLAVLLSGCQLQKTNSEFLSLPDHSKRQVQIGTQKLRLEIVNTDESRQKGLSDRAIVNSDGMLFVFPQAQILQFWMKEMRFGLDFIWIKDGKVVDITPNVPTPRDDQPLQIYSPSQPADMVLEVSDGQAAWFGIQKGQEVRLLPPTE
jgi:hypothetical protein